MTKQRLTVLLLGCVIALAMLVLASGPATAAIVNTSIPLSGNFGTSLSASGTLGVSANFNVTLSAGSIAGTPVSVTVPLVIPQQSSPITLVPNPTNVSTASTGTLALGLEDANNNGLADDFPGATSPAPALPDSQLDALLNDLDLTLIDASGAGFQTNTVGVNGNASLDILGLVTVNLPVSAAIDANAAISNLVFQGAGPGFLFGKEEINSSFGSPPPMGEDFSTRYNSALIGGDISGDVNGSVDAEIDIDLGIFGTVTQSVPNAATIANPIAPQTIPLLGPVTLEQIFTPDPITDDLNAAFDFALQDPLDFDLSLADSQAFNQNFGIPINFGFLGTFTLDGQITGTVNFDLSATFTVANTSLNVSGQDTQIIDNIIPEPSTWCMAALAMLGIVPMIRRKLKV